MSITCLSDSMAAAKTIMDSFNALVKICPTPVNEEDKKKFKEMAFLIRYKCHNILSLINSYVCPPCEFPYKKRDGIDEKLFDYEQNYNTEDD
jgi:hypothetical protein